MVPAWTDGKTIWINKDAMPKLEGHVTRATLMAWMGANYHELGHTLFSPKHTSKLKKRLRKAEEADDSLKNILRTENLVEDPRQERLMIKRYRYLKPYIVQATWTLVLRGLNRDLPDHTVRTAATYHDSAEIGSAWPWIAGRTWLPEDIRRASLAQYRGDGKKLAELIGQYQQIVDPATADHEEAATRLFEIHDLLRETHLPMNMPVGCENGKGDPMDQRTGAQQPAPFAKESDDEDAPPAGGDSDAAMEEEEEEADTGPGGGDSDSESDGEPDETSDSDSDGGDSGGDSAEEALDDGSPGGGASDQSGDQTPDQKEQPPRTMGDFKKAMDKASKDAYEDDDAFRDHVDRVQDSVDMDKDANESLLKQRRTNGEVKASAELIGTAHKLGIHFRKFLDAALPHWEREVDSGRLNVHRYLTQKTFDYDTMFDRLAQGMVDEVSLDVTILIDVSSSMSEWLVKPGEAYGYNDGTRNSLVDLAAEAVWAIRKAVQKAEGDCTVLAYDHNSHLVSQTGEKPHPSKVLLLHTSGSTNPVDALRDTFRRIRHLDAAHKIVVTVTDGQWMDRGKGASIMRRITDVGGTTVGVRLVRSENLIPAKGDPDQYEKMMGTEHYKVMADPHGIVDLFEKVTSERLNEVIAGAVR
jgi:hypothetical protein